MDRLLDRLSEGRALFDVRLFEISGTTVTFWTLMTFLVVIFLTMWLAGFTQKAVTRAFARAGQEDEGTAAIASRLARYAVQVVGLGVAVHSLGVNLTALFAAGAVFAVAIGFAMQNLTQNFVSGVILLMERAIKPGDILDVEGQLVRVKEMGIRATIARTLDEEDIVIPNSQLVISSVKNYTLQDSLYRLRTTVGVVYSSDMALVRSVLEQAAGSLDWRSPLQDPRVLLVEFGNSSVNFDVSVWIENPWQIRQRRSDLNEALWWALKGAGVVIAFPQLDVHFDPPVQRSLAALGAGT